MSEHLLESAAIALASSWSSGPLNVLHGFWGPLVKTLVLCRENEVMVYWRMVVG